MKHEYNHPTQGLQDMTLDLSGYSAEALSELSERIEAEKKKREVKIPFDVSPVSFNDDGQAVMTITYASIDKRVRNHYHRLNAEAKLRAAGGGSFKPDKNDYCLYRNTYGSIIPISIVCPYQGSIYFESAKLAMKAYDTLSPEEQAAIFEFGDE